MKNDRHRMAALALAAALAPAAFAQAIEGCPSSDSLNARFNEFSRTGRMPPELGRWIGDPKAQAVEPFQAFDNVWFVGICWVSAWVIKTPEGAILIDTLHDPHTGTLLENLRKVGVSPADIRYVLITHGHSDHAGGAYRSSRKLRAATVGGLGLNAIENSKQVEAYISSMDRLTYLPSSANDPVELHLTTHPFSTSLFEAARN